MSKRLLTLCAIALLLAIQPIEAESKIKQAFKKWFDDSFGIDINEKLINKPFNPTIANLNTVTLKIETEISSQEALPADAHLYSVSELAYAIDQNNVPEQTYLAIANSNNERTTYWHIHTGLETIQENEPIFVYSRGYAGAKRAINPTRKEKQRGLCSIPKRGGGIVVGSQWLKGGIINSTCVMFDYPDTRNYFDFGLKNDQQCLECVYKELSSKTDNIVFFGNCRGSKALLTYLSRSRPTGVRAVILDAPFMDLDQFVQAISKNYGTYIPFSKKITKKIITDWHPNYCQKDDITLNDLKNIPTDIPIFIGHLLGDSLVSNEMIKKMVQTLRDSGHKVYLLVIDDKTKSHSRLYQTKPFQQAVNAFLKQYGLPHDVQLADEGKAMLSHAYYTAEHIDTWKKGFLHLFKG